MVSDGDESDSGINGGLMCAGGGLSGTVNTIGVDDIVLGLHHIDLNAK